MDKLSMPRWIIGSCLLASALSVGLYGIVMTAVAGPYGDGERNPNADTAQQDPLYVEECAACHLAYPPGMLPQDSWQRMMRGLEDHFGDNAEMDAETYVEIETLLNNNALQRGTAAKYSQFARNLPAIPPLRITELPYMLQAHQSVEDAIGAENMTVGFLSPCEDCHREAADGIFDKDRLPVGYGPGVNSN